uniref:Trafficking protein particle complex subunit 4 n=1 Tax=Pavo cristatus TaxID=9049 RepID=A0A8C9EP00_PAVCR
MSYEPRPQLAPSRLTNRRTHETRKEKRSAALLGLNATLCDSPTRTAAPTSRRHSSPPSQGPARAACGEGPRLRSPRAGSHLFLGLAARLVDRILVLLGGLARVLLLLIVFGRLRDERRDGTMRKGGSAQLLAPTPRLSPHPAPRSPCCGCCCSQDVGRERKPRTRGSRKTLRRGAGYVTSLPPSDATTSLPQAGGAMAIFSVYVVNKAGGLIYQLDHYAPRSDTEKTFSFPLDLVLRPRDERVVVAFGQRDGIRVGHAVLAINGAEVNGRLTADGKDVLEFLSNPANYPVSIRFGRHRLSSNEKLMLASMFHSLFAIGSQLSPEVGSSGIEMLETDTFKLHCFQTLTGIKFVVLADPRQAGIDALLRKIYEIYSDFALKNPFYSLEMPIRCELFDQNLKLALEVAEKAGPFGPGS